MTPEEFIILSKDQKISILWREANYVANRKEAEYFVYLYQVYSFYFEVYYCKNLVEIHKIQIITNTNESNVYLEKIDITSLSN